MHKPCLLLNVDYTPVTIIDWRKAICWYFRIQNQRRSNIEILAYHNDSIIGLNAEYQLPSVIKSNIYIRTYRKNVKFSRQNLFLRDNSTCQYCGNKYHHSKLTYDHVVPKSKWKNKSSPTCWHNIVTACYRCNRKKGNKTPDEAGMHLLNKPHVPQFHKKYLPWFGMLSNIEYSSTWKDFLDKDYFQHENQYQ